MNPLEECILRKNRITVRPRYKLVEGDELATDLHNPLVLRQFILAQEKLGNSVGAEASRTRLKYLRASTVEWFLVAGSATGKAH